MKNKLCPLKSAILIILLILMCTSLAKTSQPLPIAFSQRFDATAFNNGRRMARTSDDRLVIVYQDSMQDKAVVMWLSGQAGRDWTQPQVLDYGKNPALTIDNQDRIYVAWVLSDGKGIGIRSLSNHGLEWDVADTSKYIRPENVLSCSYPAIEWQDYNLYVVWQQNSKDLETANIYFQLYDPLYQSESETFRISSDSSQALYPVIAGDLEFYPGLIHILWTEFNDLSSRIMYSNMYDGHFTQNKIVLPSSYNKVYPSVSVRNYEIDHAEAQSSMTLAYSDPVHGALVTQAAEAWDFGIECLDSDSIATDYNALVSVDDVILSSCAVVWQSYDDIYYAQNVNGHFIFPPKPLNDMIVIENSYPSVCYKTFRYDSIDVVWTAGNKAPYAVMYRRMAKQYSPNAVKVSQSLKPQTFRLLPNYPNPFNAATTIPIHIGSESHVTVSVCNINGQKVTSLLSQKLLPGNYKINWDGTDRQGNLATSGIYIIKATFNQELLTQKAIMLR